MLQFYKPNHNIIPKDSPLQRRFPKIHEIPWGEETKFDTATLLYDIFLITSTNRLISLEPAFLNLKKDLFPMSVICRDKALKYELEEKRGLHFFESETLNEIPNSQIRTS